MKLLSPPCSGRLPVAILFMLFLCSCQPREAAMTKDNLLTTLLAAKPQQFGAILQDPGKYRLQILYTRIDRDAENHPRFTSHALGVQNERYFYPASTVKLPAAILALEKINRLNIDGLSKYTPLIIDSAYEGQSSADSDSSAQNGRPSIAQYIKKILLVSDNDAYNRLYEFIGQKALNESLWMRGFTDTKLIRRLSVVNTPDQSRHTNPLRFYNGETVIYEQPLVENPQLWQVDMPEVRQGKGYMSGDELINEPIDFSHSNYFPVADQQGILRALLFPEATPENRRFDLTEEDYRFLYRYMSMLPGESRYPSYQDSSEYYDSYVKYIMFGDSKGAMPDDIRVFNKVGQAYGYLIDNAYVADFKNGVEFLLTVVIQVNENQIYNDDTYEYESVGSPFLGELGRTIYEYELKRERSHKPDLSRFKVH